MAPFIRASLAAAVLLVSRPALADDLPPAIVPEEVAAVPGAPGQAIVPGGLAITAGVGVVSFVSGEATDLAEAGGSWDVRVRFATRYVISAELAYIGSMQGTDVAGLDPRALLMANGVEAAGRVNILAGAVQPYVFVGFGYRHYDIIDSSFNSSIMRDSDQVFHVPLGGGVSLRFARLFFDVRFTFRPTFSSSLMGPLIDLSTVSGDALIGVEL